MFGIRDSLNRRKCPKCGSHKTHRLSMVFSDDKQIRCDACGYVGPLKIKSDIRESFRRDYEKDYPEDN
jgi:uncharacterized Zn finger protein